LPSDQGWAEFMEPRKYRVKTCKLRGVLSQGLALPIDILPGGDYQEGDDVTEVLGVTKYEPPAPKDCAAKGNFPPFIPKTSELRIQSSMNLIDQLTGLPYFITVKYDGQSMTVANHPTDGFIVASRNQTLKLKITDEEGKTQDANNNFVQTALKLDLERKLPQGFAVQGELMGPGIQNNRLELKEYDFFVYNVFDIMEGEFFNFHDMVNFVTQYGLRMVPVVEISDGFAYTLDELLEKAKGKYRCPESGRQLKSRREGLIVRPQESLYTQKGNRLSFKVMNNDFLLKDED